MATSRPLSVSTSTTLPAPPRQKKQKFIVKESGARRLDIRGKFSRQRCEEAQNSARGEVVPGLRELSAGICNRLGESIYLAQTLQSGRSFQDV